MEAVLSITAPIFFLIFLGYLGVRFQVLPQDTLPGLSRFVVYFALPALVFTKLLSMDLAEVVNLDYMLIYTLGGLFALVFTILLSRLVFKDSWEASGVRGLGAALPNSAFIGFPVILQMFEHPPAQAFAMSVMVENIVLMPAALIFLETMMGKRQGNKGSVFVPVVKRISSNPIIISVFLGLLCSSLGLKMPAFISYGLGMLSQGAACVALVVIGGSLCGVSIKCNIGQMSLVAMVKLLIFPMVVSGLVLLFPDLSSDLKTSVIIFAAVPMFSIYPIIGGEYGERSFCASTLLVTTILSFVSLSVWLHFLV
ncbi:MULTISPECIES: AEC family transporter [unclassified Agarivorans]|uniref:AEC family transporter n=1 Tax=unclassified Agarivorans TaxID=2636026 RepID=UPI003D7C9A1C